MTWFSPGVRTICPGIIVGLIQALMMILVDEECFVLDSERYNAIAE